MFMLFSEIDIPPPRPIEQRYKYTEYKELCQLMWLEHNELALFFYVHNNLQVI